MTYISLRSHDLLGYKSPAREVLTPARNSAGGLAIPVGYAARTAPQAVNARTFWSNPPMGTDHQGIIVLLPCGMKRSASLVTPRRLRK